MGENMTPSQQLQLADLKDKRSSLDAFSTFWKTQEESAQRMASIDAETNAMLASQQETAESRSLRSALGVSYGGELPSAIQDAGKRLALDYVVPSTGGGEGGGLSRAEALGATVNQALAAQATPADSSKTLTIAAEQFMEAAAEMRSATASFTSASDRFGQATERGQHLEVKVDSTGGATISGVDVKRDY
jgi:hypothetical protein